MHVHLCPQTNFRQCSPLVRETAKQRKRSPEVLEQRLYLGIDARVIVSRFRKPRYPRLAKV